MAGPRQRQDETPEQFAERKAAWQQERESSRARDAAPQGREPKAPVDYRPRLAGLLLVPNELLASFPPTSDLALTQEEFGRALDVGNMAAQQKPGFRRWLKRAESAELTLAVVAFAITYALPRLDARGLLPPWLKRGLANASERAQQYGVAPDIPVYPNGAQAPGHVPPVWAPAEAPA